MLINTKFRSLSDVLLAPGGLLGSFLGFFSQPFRDLLQKKSF